MALSSAIHDDDEATHSVKLKSIETFEFFAISNVADSVRSGRYKFEF